MSPDKVRKNSERRTAAFTGSPALGYRRIAEELRRRVVEEEVSHGNRIGTERDLCERWNVSRSTVRKALQELAADGLIVSYQGLGWFVAEPRLHQRLAELEPLNDILTGYGEAKVRVTTFGFVKPPLAVATALRVKSADDLVLLLERLHYFKGKPLALLRIWFIHSVGRHLSLDDAKAGTIFPALPAKTGIRIISSSQAIRAIALNERDAKLMKLKTGEPVLRVDRVSFTKANEAIACTEIQYDSDRFELRMTLKWSGAEAWHPFIAPGVGLNELDESLRDDLEHA